jgi:hypothetical protein
MFEVTVTDEFARWFESLDEPAAIQIASALEIVEAKGNALGLDRASNLLLFYDSTLAEGDSSTLAELSHQYHKLMLHQREAVRCLASTAFADRLAQLDERAAARALSAVGTVTSRIGAARALLTLQFGNPTRRKAYQLTPADRAKAIAHARWALEQNPQLPVPASLVPSFPVVRPESVRDALHEALGVLGLDPGDLADTTSGLRELTLTRLNPRLRVIYGIDVPRRQIVVLLGEPLTRAYYGDSIRLAEQRWREYCAEAAPLAQTG